MVVFLNQGDLRREIKDLRDDLRYEKREIKHLREEKWAMREWQAVVENHLKIELVQRSSKLVVLDKS